MFIYAPREYRITKVMEMYGDTKEQAANLICKYVKEVIAIK